MSKILIASKNIGKIKEFEVLFRQLNIEVESLLDYPEIKDVEETGNTFEANARLKAETIAKLTNQIVLADDSGLCVEALNGAPGVYSARFAGEPSNSKKNNHKLLQLMTDINERSAYFVACLVVAHPMMESLVVEGRAYGHILTEERGVDGFGYDPLFYYPELDRSFAELSMEQKNQVSHRADALKKLLEKLPSWLEELNVK